MELKDFNLNEVTMKLVDYVYLERQDIIKKAFEVGRKIKLKHSTWGAPEKYIEECESFLLEGQVVELDGSHYKLPAGAEIEIVKGLYGSKTEFAGGAGIDFKYKDVVFASDLFPIWEDEKEFENFFSEEFLMTFL
ncbi:gp645 [Bacillus phage G]|uniref:Gp645 n=1 Tax=Bacillus phage G TaxID=2884420 RepID=G3MB25_9CAUD|nr:gp645 [Bacillus phage G]AEO93888.1 gp645 [Bacillus phage G]